jgi:hypothetical protein
MKEGGFDAAFYIKFVTSPFSSGFVFSFLLTVQL